MLPLAEKFEARAKYVPDPETGKYRLAMVQGFTSPVFAPEGTEARKPKRKNECDEDDGEAVDIIGNESDVERASRRARIGAFDKILCTLDLDTFCTFTFDPHRGVDVMSYEACYDDLRVWLSNRVQRRGLKYVLVPEHHKSGAIHFHAIMNSAALTLERARSAKSGRALSHQGNALYNVKDWAFGFSSAEVIRGGTEDRTKVSKYIFKYMGKQFGQKIGGRYVLSGGDLGKPLYVYAHSFEELLSGDAVTYDRRVSLPEGGEYFEASYL